ncbi:MAG: tyrosine-type recombinase/integrase [Desulfarculaceae bacterium]|nr:tyrosine-type recombinase/integrase [Desulfarculaceae bacterium]MCF8045913.1 tyrosine-type recombinase/integrase [Desulfarculaceae bacterium]MCF8066902.1 tyrosine-type recombinase/integrase [Desulfarculaceae bacterium]MCF8097931.1 tyrosine-type recombinase/integrase [Desulfarculaceae bacterium]MCF8121116.1 tyrosine-type recombinase/integrase [Desulfarculaceae bacterium]
MSVSKVWIEVNRNRKAPTYSTRWIDEDGKRGRRTFKRRWEAEALRDRLTEGYVSPLAPDLDSIIGVDRPNPQQKCLTAWGPIVEQFIDQLAVQLKPGSIRRHREALHHFTRFFTPATLEEAARKELVLRYRSLRAQDHKGTKPITRCTINNEVSKLRRFFGFAMELGLAAENPCDGIKALKETDSKADTVILEVDEIRAFEAHCCEEFRPCFAVLVRLGLRKGELLALTARDLDLKARVLCVTNFKTTTGSRDRYRRLPLNDRVMELLRLQEATSAGGPLFPIPHSHNWLRRKLRQVARQLIKSGVLPAHKAGIRLHDLRHTYASHFLASGGDLRTLMYLLGHNRIETTQRYLHPLEGRMAKAANVISY